MAAVRRRARSTPAVTRDRCAAAARSERMARRRCRAVGSGELDRVAAGRAGADRPPEAGGGEASLPYQRRRIATCRADAKSLPTGSGPSSSKARLALSSASSSSRRSRSSSPAAPSERATAARRWTLVIRSFLAAARSCATLRNVTSSACERACVIRAFSTPGFARRRGGGQVRATVRRRSMLDGARHDLGTRPGDHPEPRPAGGRKNGLGRLSSRGP